MYSCDGGKVIVVVTLEVDDEGCMVSLRRKVKVVACMRCGRWLGAPIDP